MKLLVSWVQFAEILGDPYHKMVPLPRIPNYCNLGRRQNPFSVHKAKLAQQTRLRKILDMLNGHVKLVPTQ